MSMRTASRILIVGGMAFVAGIILLATDRFAGYSDYFRAAAVVTFFIGFWGLFIGWLVRGKAKWREQHPR